jgi:glycosyltransferase involved in cell wall biosynthesis
MLGTGIIESRVIPYGVDLDVFHPADMRVARANLGIPVDAKVVLFTANGVRRNRFKDFTTVRAAVARVSERLKSNNVILIALGEDSDDERIGSFEIRFIPYQMDPTIVAQYYQAADLYLHAAKADNFPNVILEALSCGTPVIATAVGGIPEQVKGLSHCGPATKWNHSSPEEATGILIAPGYLEHMAFAAEWLLHDKILRSKLSDNAAHDARQRFDLKSEVKAYLNWYENIVEAHTH